MTGNRDSVTPYAGAVRPMTPGGRTACYGGRQGTNRSAVGGSVSAVYKRQGGRLKTCLPG